MESTLKVMALKQRGVKAEYLSSAQTDSSVQSNAECGRFDVLYMTPEKACLIPKSFWLKLLNIGICLLAVDEAHCISEWGHDFRVEYKHLDKLRDILYNVPFVGLTATATEKSFIRDEIQVIVATIAFGMGIDKPNIRHVVHYGCPKSLESYYQESGRCGRDGIASNCWLYYTRSDFAKADFYCREAHSESQRKAIIESFMAAQHYCILTTCRRKYLLEYFGESCAFERCGYCDNCTSSRKETDMSREAFLLMACIKSCGGRWCLNMPVDVLRGSRSKKVIDAQYDKLPFHGLGKEVSANWWKTLASQLISFGYLTESVKDVYVTISVSPKGVQFLSSCMPDHQPPLLLPVIDDFVGEAEHKNPMGEAREVNGMAPLKSEGLSEAEVELFKMLLEERMKLARTAGIAPYAICGDQTLKKIVLMRPSTKARLANIDGVNQHLVAMYGDHILQTIRHLSEGLDLSLDGLANLQAVTRQKVYTVPNHSKELTPAKFQAWKMFQEDGLSIQKIASFPGRSAPIKEQTVLGYILDAAQEGCTIDWTRFSEEIGLNREVYINIQVAISKVGSKDKLKPIKDELPEEVSYSQIKTVLTMQDLGMSEDVFAPNYQPGYEADERSNPTAEVAQKINIIHYVEREFCESAEKPLGSKVDRLCLEKENGTDSETIDSDDLHSSSRKRQKVGPQKSSTVLEATENSITDWLGKFENGVCLSDILEHFNGSTEESVVGLLSSLESEFLIFKKKDTYKLM